ncbi:hypothetical protein ACHAWC_000663 [Mediolabrus comicus]
MKPLSVLLVIASVVGAAAFLTPTPQIKYASFRLPVTTTCAPSHYCIIINNNNKLNTSVGRPLMLSATEEASKDNDDDISMDKKIQGRKNRVILGYKAMTMLYIAVEVFSASKRVPVNTLLGITSYIAMPAGLSYILISAAKHDRLGSDTYKRLNLSLLEYAVIGLFVIALSGGGNPILKVAYIMTLINTIKGYTYGVVGWDKKSGTDTLLQDFTRGIVSTIKGICSVPKNTTSFGYLAATLMVISMKILKLKDVIVAFLSSIPANDIALLLARFNRLSLLALMIYTLKDAADRERLGGTTFIQLNYLCALVLGIIGTLGDGMMTLLGGANIATAVFFALNGISSYVKKKK